MSLRSAICGFLGREGIRASMWLLQKAGEVPGLEVEPEHEDLVDEVEDDGGGVVGPDAVSMLVDPEPPSRSRRIDPPLEGSLEARRAKARGGW